MVYPSASRGLSSGRRAQVLEDPGHAVVRAEAGISLRFREEGELLFHLSALIPAVVRPLHVGAIERASRGRVRAVHRARVARRRVARGSCPEADARRASRRSIWRARRACSALLRERSSERTAFPGPKGVVSVLHRDLKPENLFIAKAHGEDTIKILDFGIGKVKGAATQIVGRASNEGRSHCLHADLRRSRAVAPEALRAVPELGPTFGALR